MRPSPPLAPGWCEVGSGEPPSIALGRHTETQTKSYFTGGRSARVIQLKRQYGSELKNTQ